MSKFGIFWKGENVIFGWLSERDMDSWQSSNITEAKTSWKHKPPYRRHGHHRCQGEKGHILYVLNILKSDLAIAKTKEIALLCHLKSFPVCCNLKVGYICKIAVKFEICNCKFKLSSKKNI
jgi:hypothetical protein